MPTNTLEHPSETTTAIIRPTKAQFYIASFKKRIGSIKPRDIETLLQKLINLCKNISGLSISYRGQTSRVAKENLTINFLRVVMGDVTIFSLDFYDERHTLTVTLTWKSDQSEMVFISIEPIDDNGKTLASEILDRLAKSWPLWFKFQVHTSLH